MSAEEKLREFGYELPPAPKARGLYATHVYAGQFIFTSGTSSFVGDELKYRGKLGRELTLQEGIASAKLAVLNVLSMLKNELGSLNKIKRVIKLLVFVNCTDDFIEQPLVANGASEVLSNLFGAGGLPTRSAIGTSSLPMNCSVEVEMIVETFNE